MSLVSRSCQKSGLSVPTFLLIGGQRCGSSWVHKCLAEHPDVFMATPKELHYFNRNFEKGEQWYLEHFALSGGHKAVGEATPDYIADEQVPSRAAELCPHAQLIAVIREPIERAYSLYQLKRGSALNYPTFGEAIDHHPEILEHGLYAKHISRWREFFREEQLLVLLYDDLVRSDRETISRIYEHIGVNNDFVPSWVGKADNAAIFPLFRSRLRAIGLDPLVKAVGRTPIGDALRRRARKNKRTASPLHSIDPGVLMRLEEYFRGPNEQLREMLARDLSNWS